MFWKDPKGLKSIPMYSKIGISILLIVAGVGYLLGFATIVSTYSPIDEKPGMSVADIRIAFYGAREKTKLEKSIDGTMSLYGRNDNSGDYNYALSTVDAFAALTSATALNVRYFDNIDRCWLDNLVLQIWPGGGAVTTFAGLPTCTP